MFVLQTVGIGRSFVLIQNLVRYLGISLFDWLTFSLKPISWRNAYEQGATTRPKDCRSQLMDAVSVEHLAFPQPPTKWEASASRREEQSLHERLG